MTRSFHPVHPATVPSPNSCALLDRVLGIPEAREGIFGKDLLTKKEQVLAMRVCRDFRALVRPFLWETLTLEHIHPTVFPVGPEANLLSTENLPTQSVFMENACWIRSVRLQTRRHLVWLAESASSGRLEILNFFELPPHDRGISDETVLDSVTSLVRLHPLLAELRFLPTVNGVLPFEKLGQALLACRHLTELSLGNMWFTDRTLVSIFAQNKKLIRTILNFCKFDSRSGLNEPWDQNKLKSVSLCLAGSFSTEDEAILVNMFRATLDLNELHLPLADQKMAIKVSGYLRDLVPKLTILTLQDLDFAIKDGDVARILESARPLELLSLDGTNCWQSSVMAIVRCHGQSLTRVLMCHASLTGNGCDVLLSNCPNLLVFVTKQQGPLKAKHMGDQNWACKGLQQLYLRFEVSASSVKKVIHQLGRLGEMRDVSIDIRGAPISRAMIQPLAAWTRLEGGVVRVHRSSVVELTVWATVTGPLAAKGRLLFLPVE